MGIFGENGTKLVICLEIALGLLLVIAAVLVMRILQYKWQLRSFTRRIKERKNTDMNQLVTVDYFDKDIVKLADSLNEYTDMVKQQTIQIEKDRRQLKSVIAGISHDFRTPLTAAKGYMQMIDKGGALDEKNREYLHIAIDKTNYLKTLSDAFFEVSAIEANEEPAMMEQVHLAKLLSEKILGQYDWIKGRGLITEFDIPDQDIIVNSNTEFLNRIFENLFSNAKKYAASRLIVKVTRSANQVVVSFENDTDNSGELDVNRVFDAFYRDRSRHSEGSGLGLYVVKCLADKTGHKVWAELRKNIFGVYIALDITS